MDGLVSELLRLEGAKHKALVEIDAPAYDECVRQQLQVLAIVPTGEVDLERLLALSQLIQLNKHLLQNLVSTTPWFAFSENGYTANGSVKAASNRRVTVEA